MENTNLPPRQARPLTKPEPFRLQVDKRGAKRVEEFNHKVGIILCVCVQAPPDSLPQLIGQVPLSHKVRTIQIGGEQDRRGEGGQKGRGRLSHLGKWESLDTLPCQNNYTPRNEVRGGILESPCPSVCPAAFGFPAHNCFPFTPIIMKLHMQTPHEARMCPIDFEVKGQGHNA